MKIMLIIFMLTTAISGMAQEVETPCLAMSDSAKAVKLPLLINDVKKVKTKKQ